jgi:hypothetical protein
LDEEGHLDIEAWRHERGRCIVRRFDTEGDRLGLLRHRAGGASGATWIIDYDQRSSEDDGPGYRLDLHTFRQGEYITIQEQDGPQTYRIVEVRPASRSARLPA